MLLSEAVEEIQEKAPNYLSMESIIRKISQVRNRLIRTYGQAVVPMQMDLLQGVPNYPWRYPAGSIVSVLVNGVKWPYAQLNSLAKAKYYFLLDGSIGISQAPEESVTQGLTILYNKALVPLTVNDLNSEVGFDMDYDALVVYGALKDMTTGSEAAEYAAKYNDMLTDYLRASTSPEAHTIVPGVEW